MKTYDAVIIGGGISGMSLAHQCAKAGLSTAVLEKAERTGGSFHSHSFEGEGGFWIELGAHTCYNSYGSLVELIEERGLLDKLVPREKVPFKLLVDGNVKSIPSRLSFPELMLHVPRMFGAKKEGETMSSYYSKILGSRNYKNVFGPVFDAIISQDASGFPADALFKKRPRRQDVLKSFTLTRGLQTITDAVAADPAIDVFTGIDAQAVEYSGGRFRVGAGGEAFEARYLGVATPPPAAAKLLAYAFPELSAHLSKIKLGTVETVGVALGKKQVHLPPLAGLIASGDSFFSSVTRDTVKDENYRGFAFHFRPGLLDFGSKMRRISEVLGVANGQIEHVVIKNDNCVPSLSLGHGAWLAGTEGLTAGKPLMLTGNYFSGVAIEDCVARSKGEFARVKALPQ